jgi:glycosyltransferase involved in cell wall biosynthesis
LVLRAVRSAQKQTFRQIEVIVVIDGENGSSSADAIKHLDDPRIRCIALPHQVGGSEARNVGVSNARSGWIALLDDDDEWLPSKLETQFDAARHQVRKQNVVVTCRHIQRAQGAADVVRPRRLPREGEPPCEFMFDYLCYFQTSTFVCSKDLMLRIPFTKDLSFFQDIDWFFRAMRAPDVQLVVVPQPLSIYHAPERRQTVTSSARWTARLDWGRANRHLMSKRSYSRFVVGSCVGPAVRDGAGAAGFARLLYECAIMGSPTPQLLMLMFGTYLLRPGLRKKLRDRFLLTRAQAPIDPDAAAA